MEKMEKWQEECAQLMRDVSVLQVEYIYKLRNLRNEYQPKIDDIKSKIENIYIQQGLIDKVEDEEDGKVVQELQ